MIQGVNNLNGADILYGYGEFVIRVLNVADRGR